MVDYYLLSRRPYSLPPSLGRSTLCLPAWDALLSPSQPDRGRGQKEAVSMRAAERQFGLFRGAHGENKGAENVNL